MSGQPTGTVQQPGVYGTLGKAAIGNVPGARENAHSWTDGQGNLWLFGGYGYDSTGSLGYLNDLWEFSPSTSEWAWMGGSSTIPNCSIYCGQPGVYGTFQVPATGNFPGARSSAYTWTDRSGNFWLFGGIGFDSAGNFTVILDDLWEFSPSTNKWAWMSGISTFPANCTDPLAKGCILPGIYGTLQTPASGNIPGARRAGVTWTDSQGNLWLFGGDGFDATGIRAYLNDLWEFTPSTSEWTWMSGSNTASCSYTFCSQIGVYGTWQTPALGNTPGSRYNAVSWTDTKSNFWLYGGTGTDVVGAWSAFDDLWEFQPNTGSSKVAATPTISPDSGSYTTEQTVTISDTTPGSTIYYMVNGIMPASEYTVPILISTAETIEAIAGASGYGNSNVATATYTVNLPVAVAPTFSLASGAYTSSQTVAMSDTTPGSTIYYTTDGTMPTASSSVYRVPITVSSSQIIEAVAVAGGYANSALASAVYTIGPNSSIGEWTWMGGNNTVLNDSQGWPVVCGTLGTPSAGNYPGSRMASATWTDKYGYLWLFGGQGTDANGYINYLNDLWKFNPSTNQWTCIKNSSPMKSPTLGFGNRPGLYGTLGSPGSGNTPGGRNLSATWIDNAGHFWLFGGYGADANGGLGKLNDLWEYDPSTNQWAWMSGSSTLNNGDEGQFGVYGVLGKAAAGNVPGSRYYATSWTDHSGNLWLFGGEGSDSFNDLIALNDLWVFNPSTNEWTWMGGSNSIPTGGGQPGVYGILGTPSVGNAPGSRYQAAGWTDNSGNLWLFGGFGYDSTGNDGYLNDIWEFDPAINQWAWMAGSNLIPCKNYSSTGNFGGYFCGQLSVYGTLGVPAAGSYPGGRAPAAYWTDNSGNLWLLGGKGLDAAGEYIGPMNDLWYFNPSTDLWTWMGGESYTSNCISVGVGGISAVQCYGSSGRYGTLGIPAAGNLPGYRASGLTWIDNSSNLWLLGGYGLDINGMEDVLGDIWEDPVSTTTLPPMVAPEFSQAPGTFTTGGPVTIFDRMADTNIYYTTNGITPTSASTLLNGPVTVSSTVTIEAIATAQGYRDSGVASATYVIEPPAATPVISLQSGTYTSVQTVTISDTTPGATITYSTDNGVTVNQYTGPITIAATETLIAEAIATGYSASNLASATYTLILPPAATPTFSVPAGTYTAIQTVTISDATSGATIYYTTDGSTPTTSSAAYNGQITVSWSETLKAIAWAIGYSSSPVASAAYTINNPIPVISSISPAYINAGSAAFTLTVNGTGFTTGSMIMWGTSFPTTTYVSATQLTTQISAIDIATAGNTIAITVITPGPGGANSNSYQFEVNSASGSTTGPTFTSTTATVTAGSTASYPVTLPSTVQSASVTCLNLPTGAACNYSAATNTLTITTSSTTPKGTYQITVVFSETVTGAATSWILLPILLLPLVYLRRKLAARGAWITASLGCVLLAAAAYTVGCGGGGSASTYTPPVNPTHQVISSGSVSITIQ
jgi:N-acetylneuraminic acid mutarotase